MLNVGVNEVASQTHYTQVSSFFDIIDNMVKVGDTDKKYYQCRVPCTAPPVPITDNGWTTISLMPKGGNMVDLYNSYIYVDLQFQIKMQYAPNPYSASATNNVRSASQVWVGYKDAMDCIAQYQIHCNGEEVYSQSHALRESFLTATCLPDTVKSTDAWSRSRFDDIWYNRDCHKTGAFMKFDGAYTDGGDYNETITIQLKIDFRRFLPFSGIKYLPAFVQNLQLKVQFSTRGLVCANMGWQQLLKTPAQIKNIDLEHFEAVTTRFNPIGQPFYMYNNPSKTSAESWSDTIRGRFPALLQTLVVKQESFSVRRCRSVLHTFSIDRNIYLSLVQRYTANALVFPIQTLVVNQTNGNFTTGEPVFLDFTVQHIPRFVDAIFFFFPYNRYWETCFMNPDLRDITVSMGDFGAYRFDGSADAEFYENIQNVLNLNNDVMGMPKDLMNSYTTHSASGMGDLPNDDTNYIFGIPCSVDNTFQQGQTSQSIVAYTFTAKVYNGSGVSDPQSIYKNSACIPEIGFLMDGVFAIQVIAGGGVVCRIKELDITTPTE
jgi:hypothetical protein